MNNRRIWFAILASVAVLSGVLQRRSSTLEGAIEESAEQLYSGARVSRKPDKINVSYRFELKSGQYFEVSVQKSGTDLALSLLQPDGRIIRSVGCSHDGRIQISELASISGRYVLGVNPCDQRSSEPIHELTLSEIRLATRSDRLRVEAERLLADADLLIAEYRASSTRNGIRKYEQAIRHWVAVNDRAREIEALNTIARLYRELGDLERGTVCANRAFTVARSKRDVAAEAETYLSVAMIYVSQGDANKGVETCFKALDIARTIKNKSLEAKIQYFLGDIYYNSLSDYEKATDALNQAQNIWLSTGNRLGQARSLVYRAAVDFDLVVSTLLHKWRGRHFRSLSR